MEGVVKMFQRRFALFLLLILWGLLLSQPALALTFVQSLDGFYVGEQVRLIGYYTASSDGQGPQYRFSREYFYIDRIAAGTPNPFALRPLDKPGITGWTNAAALQHLHVAVTDVSLSNSSAFLVAGKTLTLSAVVNPSNATNKSVTWSSSSESVATVSEGVVTGKKAGDAIITAQAEGKTASCKVKVVWKFVPVKSVGITPKSCTVYLNNAKQLKPTISPSNATDKTTRGESDNPSVATVSAGGLVKAVGLGKATITVKSSNDKKSTCMITVKIKAVSGVSLPGKASVEITRTKQLTAKVSPSTATDKTVRWSSDNEQVATVSNSGVVTAWSLGNAVITAKSNNNKKDTCKVTVTPISVSSVALPATAKVTKGSSITLGGVVSPGDASNKKLTWTSSKKSVVTVTASGVVTGVKGGSATITAKAHNGKKATCKVTVVDPVVRRALAIGAGNPDYGDTGVFSNELSQIRAMFSLQRYSGASMRISILDNPAYASQALSAIPTAFAGSDSNDVNYLFLSCHGSDPRGGKYRLWLGNYSSVTAAQLKSALDKVKGRVIILIDSCHAGDIIGKETTQPVSGRDFIDAFLAGDGISSKTGELATSKYRILCSARRTQLAGYSYDLNMGFFIESVCRGGGWNGVSRTSCSFEADANLDNLVTLEELRRYCAQRVNDWTDYDDQDVVCWPSNDPNYLIFSRY